MENLQRKYYTEKLNEEDKLMQIRKKLDELAEICKYNFWDFQMVLRIKEALGVATEEEKMQIVRIRGEEATETSFQILERFEKTKELELEVANKRDLRIAKQEVEKEISILQEIKQILKELPSNRVK
jgi:phosphopantetheine adenylyltransferase